MSIFEAGFILWGFLAMYLIVIVAYLVWARAMNRKEARTGAERVAHDNGGKATP